MFAMNFRRCALTAATGLLLLLTACTTPVPQETTDEFSRLATAAASLAGRPAEVQVAALTEAESNERLCRYLSGHSFTLGAPRTRVQATRLARQQGEAGAALENYVKALVDAVRGESLQTLTSAQANFNASAREFAQAAGREQPVDIAEHTLALIARAGEANRQARIRSAMREAIDPLFILEALLSRDALQVVQETEAAVARWEVSASCVLEQRRRNADATALHERFDERATYFSQQIAAINNAPEAVRKLRIAHILAVTQPEDFETAIQEVSTVLQEMDALRTAFRR